MGKCSRCKKPWDNIKLKTCDDCRNRQKQKRKDKLKAKIFCKGKIKQGNRKGEPCESEAKEDGYCKNHSLESWKEKQEKDEIHKTCTNYIRGCKNILLLSEKYSRCENCREADRIKDKNNRDSKQKEIEDENKKSVMTKKCSRCKEQRLIDSFQSDRNQNIKNCHICRKKERDKKRDRTDRDYGDYDSRPEVKQRKKEWKEDNYEKVAGYWINSRKKQIEELGVKEYLAKNAAYRKKYLDENPEKRQKLNDDRRQNINAKLNYYKREAENKGRLFKLPDDISKKMFLNNCFYCGIEAGSDDFYFNGIDRKDNNLGYTLNNSVAACNMCNMIKGDRWCTEDFLKVVEHILTNMKIINESLIPQLFKDYRSNNYEQYLYKSDKRGIEFKLLEIEFYSIVSQPCYLCGKTHSDKHNNGVDRLDNSKSYIINNCVSCCGNCNYMKKEYDLDILFDKMISIHEHQNKKNVNTNVNANIIFNAKINLITNEEMNVQVTRRKVVQGTFRQNERNKYGDEGFKKIEALKKKITRSKKIENNECITSQLQKDLVLLKTNLCQGIQFGKNTNKQKKTKEEKMELNRIRKQKQRNNLIKKYGTEIYRKIGAFEVAITRAKKSGNEENRIKFEKQLLELKKQELKE